MSFIISICFFTIPLHMPPLPLPFVVSINHDISRHSITVHLTEVAVKARFLVPHESIKFLDAFDAVFLQLEYEFPDDNVSPSTTRS